MGRKAQKMEIQPTIFLSSNKSDMHWKNAEENSERNADRVHIS